MGPGGKSLFKSPVDVTLVFKGFKVLTTYERESFIKKVLQKALWIENATVYGQGM